MNATEAKDIADKANYITEMNEVLKEISDAAEKGLYQIRRNFGGETMSALNELGYYTATAESPFIISWTHPF